MDFKSYLISFIVAFVIGFVTVYWKNYRAQFKAMLTNYIQQLEVTVQGSKMGAVRKALLLQILAAAGVKLPAWADKAIDNIVTALNENKAWLTEFMGNGLSADTDAETAEGDGDEQ